MSIETEPKNRFDLSDQITLAIEQIRREGPKRIGGEVQELRPPEVQRRLLFEYNLKPTLRTVQRHMIKLGMYQSNRVRDLGEQIQALFEGEGSSIADTNRLIAAKLNVSVDTVRLYLKKLYASGALIPETRTERTKQGRLISVRTLTLVPVSKRIGRASYIHHSRRIDLRGAA